nr:glutamine synthetase family protein [Clostridia bacterium]
RLSFVDLDGTQKNVAVMADVIDDILQNGLTIDSSILENNSEKVKEVCLFPDINTLHILPWRPQHGRVARFICDIKNVDKSNSVFDSRLVLKNVISELKEYNLSVNIGTDSEFYLFKTDDQTNPTKQTLDNAGYLDVSPLDKSENVRREICLTLEEMNIKPLSSHHEKGPGQNEIKFIRTGALNACDNYIIFKSVVKAISTRNGLFASFMPKPLMDNYGNGLSLNFDIAKNNVSIFNNEENKDLAENFIAGVLNRSLAGTILFNSYPNSFNRIGNFNAPSVIDFSQNVDSFIRLSHDLNSSLFLPFLCDNLINESTF